MAEENDMDQNLAYMYKMKLEAEGKQVFTKKTVARAWKNGLSFSGC